MPEPVEEFLATRQSLLERLKHWDDQESWRDFFNTYSGLIYRTAWKAGLDDAEAQDVVQDTIIAVARKMKQGFDYVEGVDSFKGWLLYLTRKQIAMAYRKRQRLRGAPAQEQVLAEVEELPDPAAANLEAIWEEEWLRTIWEAAVAKVKEQAGAKQFQMFDLYAMKERPAVEVARALGVPVAQIYLAKHRISTLVKKELTDLKTKLE